MVSKINIILGILLLACLTAFSQQSYQELDSISNRLLAQGDYQKLLDFGKLAHQRKLNFPALNLRMGISAFNLAKYTKSLASVQRVLKEDRFNQEAIIYSYWNNKLLNRDLQSLKLTKRIFDSVAGIPKPSTLKLRQVALENAFRGTNIEERGSSTYTNLYAKLNILGDIELSQSLFFFGQNIFNEKTRLSGYYARLSYMPIQNLSLIAAFNTNTVTYLNSSTPNHSILTGLAYSFPALQFQADFINSRLNNLRVQQFNVMAFLNLSSNLDFYWSQRLSYLDKHVVSSSTIGKKLAKSIWLEASATLGSQNNYVEADGLYQFNAIDVTQNKYGLMAYFFINKELTLNLGFMLEEKASVDQLLNYSQTVINTGIKWNF